MLAYCYRDGRIHLAPGPEGIPEGAIELFRGPHRDVERLIQATTEHGVIEAFSLTHSVEEDHKRLIEYLDLARTKASRLITVADYTMEALDADREPVA